MLGLIPRKHKMSLSGKLLRGLKWHNFRNVNGEYPKDISNDPHKMDEINFYKDFIKVRDAGKVHAILEQIMIYDLSNKPNHMLKEAKLLQDEGLLIKVKKEVKKSGKC